MIAIVIETGAGRLSYGNLREVGIRIEILREMTGVTKDEMIGARMTDETIDAMTIGEMTGVEKQAVVEMEAESVIDLNDEIARSVRATTIGGATDATIGRHHVETAGRPRIRAEKKRKRMWTTRKIRYVEQRTTRRVLRALSRNASRL